MKEIVIYYTMDLFNGDARLNIPVPSDYSLYDAVNFLDMFKHGNKGMNVVSAYFSRGTHTEKLE